MPSSFPLLQRIARRAEQAPAAPAIIDTISNRTIDYATLYADICNYSLELEAELGKNDLQNARVGILAEKGYPIVVALLATYAAGGLAIPLLTSLPQPEHHYMLSNGTASLLLHDKKNEGRATALRQELPEGSMSLKLVPDFPQRPHGDLVNIDAMPELSGDRKAMMLFTSGTVSKMQFYNPKILKYATQTGRPKGVVTRHAALSAQVSSIVEYWEWTENVRANAVFSPIAIEIALYPHTGSSIPRLAAEPSSRDRRRTSDDSLGRSCSRVARQVGRGTGTKESKRYLYRD